MLEWGPASGLAAAGFLAGALNALAGGGGFIVLPVLMLAGSPAIRANASGSLAVWPGVLMTMLAFRHSLGRSQVSLPLFAGIGIVGSVLGAFLLLYTSNAAFIGMLPWLLLAATLLFLFGPRLTQAALARGGSWAQLHRRPWLVPVLLSVVAVYGGYFGGGMGIMTLAVLALLGLTDIHELNAVKALLVFFISTVCGLVFIWQGAVDWKPVLPMMAGNALGGYAASKWAMGLPKPLLRKVISGLCILITLAYFAKAWF